MKLTPTLKVLIGGFAFTINVLLLIWLGIKTDALALEMNIHLYNIIFTVITILNAAMSSVLVFLGLRTPELPPPPNYGIGSLSYSSDSTSRPAGFTLTKTEPPEETHAP
jgi:hypothetical protein